MAGRSKIRETAAQPLGAGPGKARKRTEPRVLVVDQDGASHATLEACAGQGKPMKVLRAGTLAEAQRVIQDRGRIDLVLVGQALPDGEGITLLESITDRKRITQGILLADRADAELAVRAMRVGACDMLTRPLDMEDTNRRVRQALARQDRSQAPVRRARRLRKLCRKLNQDRLDISQQVDILCNDLVTAYQELAEKMQQVVQGSEYSALIKSELDLESSLRTTLEFLVQKAGPTNAAIFLPATMDEYSLGGYVNYDCPGDSVDMLLDHMADIVALRMTDRDDLAHITNSDQMHAWIGDDACYLADSELIAFGCRHEGETLAVIALFRDQETPFERGMLDVCSSIGPLLGEALARIIRVHHRHLPDLPDDEQGLADPDAPWDGADEGELPF